MPAFFPKTLYKARARVEQAVGKLKRSKRIALRCEKTAQNYGSFVALALGFILIKTVHTASSEGRYALGGLSLLAIWLFVVLPALNASTLDNGGTEFWPPFFGYRLKVTDTLIVALRRLCSSLLGYCGPPPKAL